jgi:hypothetical protein
MLSYSDRFGRAVAIFDPSVSAGPASLTRRPTNSIALPNPSNLCAVHAPITRRTFSSTTTRQVHHSSVSGIPATQRTAICVASLVILKRGLRRGFVAARSSKPRKLNQDKRMVSNNAKIAHKHWPKTSCGERQRTTTDCPVGGGSGIRTHDTVARIHAFQACAFSHSAIPPARALS